MKTLEGSFVRKVMFRFGKTATPCVVWRNPAMPHGSRQAKYCETAPEGRKYEVLEQAGHGEWIVVTVLTVVDGRPKVVAA